MIAQLSDVFEQTDSMNCPITSCSLKGAGCGVELDSELDSDTLDRYFLTTESISITTKSVYDGYEDILCI